MKYLYLLHEVRTTFGQTEFGEHWTSSGETLIARAPIETAWPTPEERQAQADFMAQADFTVQAGSNGAPRWIPVDKNAEGFRTLLAAFCDPNGYADTGNPYLRFTIADADYRTRRASITLDRDNLAHQRMMPRSALSARKPPAV